MDYEFVTTRTLYDNDTEVGICGCILLDENQAKEWSLYPDWEKRKTLFDTPALLFTVENNKINIRMPVGDYSLAPIEAYLPSDAVVELYCQTEAFVKSEQTKETDR